MFWRHIGRGWLAGIALTVSAVRGDLVLMDFDNSGFAWTYGGFVQTIGPEFVTFTDTADGWGGGGTTYAAPMDFSALADGHFRIDARINEGNASEHFTLALRDTNDNQGKWQFNVDGFGTGDWIRLTASTDLSSPQSGVNDWQNLNLSSIANIELQGQWSGADSFAMSFDNLIVQTDGFIERYPGQSPDAPWRAEAQQRIDAIRKAPLNITVQDADSNPIPDAQVQIRQKSHAFGFGSAVVLHRIAGTTPADETYREKIKECFNIAVSENDLKWPPWDGDWGGSFTHENAQAGLDWLNANEISARGHVMVWPGYSHLPQTVRAMIDEYQDSGTTVPRQEELRNEIRQAVLDHIQDIGSATAGKIETWDVINEPRANTDLMEILGYDVMADWFEAARAAAPDANLFLNEYSIITSGNPAACDLYYDTVADLQNAGAPIEGIGMQGHFSPGSLTAPQQVWTVLDRFATLGLPIQITEYDLSTDDYELQRDYLRDFMTAVFAHEKITDFLQWGFWAGAHWKPDAAMFDEDWSPRLHGEEYLRLVFDEWWTSEDLFSGAEGTAALRAFLGEYEVTVVDDDYSATYSINLSDHNEDYELIVVVPAVDFLPGDLDGDDMVGSGDLDIVRAHWGESVPVGDLGSGDASGDGLVGSADLDIIRANWGRTVPVPVPEPGWVALLFFGFPIGRIRRLS